MMGLFKVYILAVAVLLMMSQLSAQQEASTAPPTVKPSTTAAPNGVPTTAAPSVAPTTLKPNIVTTVNNSGNTTQKSAVTSAPPVVTTQSNSSSPKNNVSTPDNKTTVIVTPTPTVKPDNKTDKPNVTDTPTTVIAAKTSQPPSNTTDSGVTPKPDGSNATTTVPPPAVTTAKPPATTANKTTTDNGTNVTGAVTTAKVTTKSPLTPAPTTNGSLSTAAPTVKPTNNDTGAPPLTTSKSSPNVTAAPQTTKPLPQTTESSNTTTKKVTTTEPKTEAPVTTKPPTAATTKAPDGSQLIYINEIVVDKNGTFQKIELHLSQQFDVTHYTMVLVDGETNKYMAVVNLTNSVQQNGLLLINFTNTVTSPIVKDKGTGIAIYNTQIKMSETWSSDISGLMDALVIGKDYTGISQNLTHTLTPGVNPFVLNPNIYGQSRTISRCSSKQMRSTDMFALTTPSFGSLNEDKCKERFSKTKQMAMKISGIDCALLADVDKPEITGELSVRRILRYVTIQVNKQCRCGLTLMHIDLTDTPIKCCDGASIDMRFVASSEQHIQELTDSYETFVKNTKVVTIDNKDYTLDTQCEGHCCENHKVGPPGKTSSDKAKNVKVTIAVILSCLVVFSIVVVIVIVYMKKKNRAVYQFRMSRLAEEDDLYNEGPDHDDFVGGQEATFDIKRR